MEAILAILALTNILLIIGIIGTIVGITHLVYPSRGRGNLSPRRTRSLRER